MKSAKVSVAGRVLSSIKRTEPISLHPDIHPHWLSLANIFCDHPLEAYSSSAVVMLS